MADELNLESTEVTTKSDIKADIKKPDVNELYDSLFKATKEAYSELLDAFRRDEKYYECDFKDELDMPTQFKNEGIVLPTARDMVDTFVDHIDISNARVHVNKRSTSKKEIEYAEMMKKFYTGLIYRTNVDADISPWREGAKTYAEHGRADFKTVYDADRWPDKPAQKEGESEEKYALRMDEWRARTGSGSLPIVIEALTPGCCYPDPFYGGRLFVFEEKEVFASNVLAKHPIWKNPKDRKLGEKVQMVSYWDPVWRCEWADGEPILPVEGDIIKHGYGFLPYVFIDSGLGSKSMDGSLKKRYVGILRYIFDLLKAESRDFSISDVVLKRTAWPWGYLTGKNAGKVTEIDQQFGSYKPLPEGVEIKEMVPKVPPEALNLHLARTSDYISAHAAPRSVRGLGETGVRSGADRRLVIAEAASRYRYAEDAFKHGTAKVLTNCAMLLKNVIPGNVRVWARTPTDEFDMEIDKEKMREPFTCYVEFAPISEEDEYRRHDDLERMVTSGIVTKRWARNQMSNVDPIAMEKDEFKEILKKAPNYIQMLAQYLGGKLAAGLAKRTKAEDIQEMVKAGTFQQPTETQSPTQGQPGTMPILPGEMGMPRQMAPPIPQVPIPGSTQDLQNRMKNTRRQKPISVTQGRGINAGGNK